MPGLNYWPQCAQRYVKRMRTRTLTLTCVNHAHLLHLAFDWSCVLECKRLSKLYFDIPLLHGSSQFSNIAMASNRAKKRVARVPNRYVQDNLLTTSSKNSSKVSSKWITSISQKDLCIKLHNKPCFCAKSKYAVIAIKTLILRSIAIQVPIEVLKLAYFTHDLTRCKCRVVYSVVSNGQQEVHLYSQRARN